MAEKRESAGREVDWCVTCLWTVPATKKRKVHLQGQNVHSAGFFSFTAWSYRLGLGALNQPSRIHN
jgi:hypothetical protein